MEEALQQVKDELGPQAIILQTEHHRPFFGLFGRERFEVIAGTDAGLKVASDRNPRTLPVDRPSPEPPVSVPRVAARAYEGVTTVMAQENNFLAPGQPLPAAEAEDQVQPTTIGQYQEDLLAMGFQLSTVNMLLDGGVEPGSDVFAARLRDLARASYGNKAATTGKPARTVALIGATGSGKTTTLARLAARAAIQERSIALVTMDTQRIGAIEQLRSFADILQADFFVAHNAGDLKQALERSADADLVLVDTAGRAPNDAVGLGQLRQAFRQVELDEIHLVMPVTIRLPDARRLYRVYRSLGPNRLILTKLDETQALGGLLEIPRQVPLPVSYLTYGQRVPEDMEPATPEAVSRLIVAGLQALRAGRL